ncbi:MAG: STAS domain-containing protein [Mycobacterium sp.]
MLVVNHIRADESPPHQGRPVGRDPVRSRELSRSTVLVTMAGEVDASTATRLCARIEREMAGYRQLVLDLSEVEFFGTAGYSLLHRLHSRCAGAAVGWVLVAGSEVQRLLRVCDPDGMLPTSPNIVAAVAALARGSHQVTQLRNGLR